MAAHFFRISDRIFNYSHTVGRREYKGSGFRHPIAFALGKDGVVYVLSRAHEETVWYEGGRRVTMLTLKEEFVGEFGKYGDGDGEFRWPTSIALDSQQNLYLSDEWLRRVSIYDPRGNFLSKWEVPSPNADTPGAPTNLVFDGDDNLYVVDRTGNCVQVFTKDGKFLHRFGSQGTGPGQFDMPWGISIDPKGHVWVADWRNDRIQKLTPEGKPLACFGSSGDLPGQFNRPTGVAADQEGDIYVADWRNHRVQVFTPEFKYVTSLLGDATISDWNWEKLKSNPDNLLQYRLLKDFTPLQRFYYPVAIELDNDGRVLVLETASHRIQVYQKMTAAQAIRG